MLVPQAIVNFLGFWSVLSAGEVSLYVNNTTEKPPIGTGLNSQCKVTLEGVYKKSKSGQQPDAAAVAAFRKRLARYCSEMGARFIDYKPEGGIWMFEVGCCCCYAWCM